MEMKRLYNFNVIDYNKKIKKGDNKNKRGHETLDTPKRRLIDTNENPHYLENPYSIDIKWDWSELKITCN